MDFRTGLNLIYRQVTLDLSMQEISDMFKSYDKTQWDTAISIITQKVDEALHNVFDNLNYEEVKEFTLGITNSLLQNYKNTMNATLEEPGFIYASTFIENKICDKSIEYAQARFEQSKNLNSQQNLLKTDKKMDKKGFFSRLFHKKSNPQQKVKTENEEL